jgi:hypothetical protein
MDVLLVLVLASLGVFLVGVVSARIAQLITTDRLTREPREGVQLWFEGRWYDKQGLDMGDDDTDEWQSLGAYYLGCPWCIGVWTSGAVTLAVDQMVGLPLPVLVWIGAAWFAGRLGEG